MGNRLARETSPYLLQHAENPVDWHPWGPEALQRALDEDKPIFLSIGYSACHWCHVMERESFEDSETAALLNEHFVSIKVDREERPDLDAVYMDAVTALTGRGGWPLSVWLTPQKEPFYGGTYFPDSPRFGMPSFRQVLQSLSELWRDRRRDVDQAAKQLLANLSQERAERALRAETVHSEVFDALAAEYDPTHGGWGAAPKFPQPLLIEYLLMRHRTLSDPEIFDQMVGTLDAMALGGIFDQLGGGFHRYSTDERWLVPHFEKMLYDNAQLARCYVHAWQSLGTPLYRHVAERTLGYLISEMQHEQGGFFSSQDADTEGEEGRFFTWTPEEVQLAVGSTDAEEATRLFGVTSAGDLDGRSVLRLEAPLSADLERTDRWRTLMLEERARRVRPARDEKIIAAWNGLTLSALADAAKVFDSEQLRETAVSVGDFLSRELVDEEGRVSRSWKDGRTSGQGFLDDHSCVAGGFLSLYELTFDERWLGHATRIVGFLVHAFAREAGGLYDTSTDHEPLPVRPRSLQDTPTACGSSSAATLLLRLAAFTGRGDLAQTAAAVLESAPHMVTRAPSVFGQWLVGLHLAEVGLTEVGVVGDPADPGTQDLLSRLSRAYLPEVVVGFRSAGAATGIGMLVDREPPAGHRGAAWVCRGQTCSAAITSADALVEALDPRLRSG